MTVLGQNYGQYNDEHTAINGCIKNIEAELDTTNSNINNIDAESSGNWINVDINDWQKIYSDITTKFTRLQELMDAAGVASSNLSQTESTYSGLGETVH